MNLQIILAFHKFVLLSRTLEDPRSAASGLFFCKSGSPYYTANDTVAGEAVAVIENREIVPDVFARNVA